MNFCEIKIILTLTLIWDFPFCHNTVHKMGDRVKYILHHRDYFNILCSNFIFNFFISIVIVIGGP